MKKIMITALCLAMAAGCVGCSDSNNSSKTEESSSASADESRNSFDELAKKLDEQQKTIEKQQKKLDTVSEVFKETYGEDIFSDSFDINNMNNGFSHPIYDDTAVVDAYKTGDSSKLTDDKDIFILETASKAIKDIINDSMNDYEKEKAVYDYIFSQSHFDEGNLSAIPHTDQYSHTPYGVLHDHNAICVGNATTFKLFMDMLGIENKIIHSTEQGEHAWNLVKLDDDWYHVDITFDNGVSIPSYAMFNVSDAVKDADSYPWDHNEFPAANGTKYSFAAQNAQEINDIYGTAELFAKAINEEKPYCYFKFKLDKSIKDTDAAVYLFNRIINEATYQMGGNEYECTGISGFVNDGYYYGGISITIYKQSEEPQIPDYDIDEIDIDLGRLYDEFLNKLDVEIDLSGIY